MLHLLEGYGAMRVSAVAKVCKQQPYLRVIFAVMHHRSRSTGTPTPIAYGQRQRHPALGEVIYRQVV